MRNGSGARTPARQHLLQIAGQLFADRGFAAATCKEICKRARVNAAAIAYHFGNKERLYSAALQEAQHRMTSSELRFLSVCDTASNPEQGLACMLEFVQSNHVPGSSTWPARLIAREMLNPTRMGNELFAEPIRQWVQTLTSLVSSFTRLPQAHPAVALSVLIVISNMAALLLLRGDELGDLYPRITRSRSAGDRTSHQLIGFLLGGMEAIAEDAKRWQA